MIMSAFKNIYRFPVGCRRVSMTSREISRIKLFWRTRTSSEELTWYFVTLSMLLTKDTQLIWNSQTSCIVTFDSCSSSR